MDGLGGQLWSHFGVIQWLRKAQIVLDFECGLWYNGCMKWRHWFWLIRWYMIPQITRDRFLDDLAEQLGLVAAAKANRLGMTLEDCLAPGRTFLGNIEYWEATHHD